MTADDLSKISVDTLDAIISGLDTDAGRCQAEESRKNMLGLIMRTRRWTSRFARCGTTEDPTWAVRILLNSLVCGMRGYMLAGRLGPQDDDLHRLRTVTLMLLKSVRTVSSCLLSTDLERKDVIMKLLWLYCEVNDQKFADDPDTFSVWKQLHDALLELKEKDELWRKTLKTL